MSTWHYAALHIPGHSLGMDNSPAPLPQKNSSAFFFQSAAAFGIALLTMIVGIYYLPADPWIKGFLGLGTMFLTTSTFTLGKVIRDQQEGQYMVSRLDQVRLDRILAEHDPFKRD